MISDRNLVAFVSDSSENSSGVGCSSINEAVINDLNAIHNNKQRKCTERLCTLHSRSDIQSDDRCRKHDPVLDTPVSLWPRFSD